MYTFKQFETLRCRFIEAEEAILRSKEQEYTTDSEDRLINLRQVAEFESRTPVQVAMTLLLNQLQRINMAVQTGKYNWLWITENGREGFKQKIVDARIYLHLLAACIDEEVKERHERKKDD